MTKQLDIDRERLARLLGMCGSNHDGEVVNAARLADRLVRSAGMSWSAVLSLSEPPADDWRATVEALLARPRSLTEWECGFLTDLLSYRDLSPRQSVALAGIARRVLRTAA